MRKLLFTIVCFSFFSIVQGQGNAEKYKMIIPRSWESGEMLTILTTLISNNFPVLKISERCADCDAGYTVSIATTKPVQSYQFISNTFQKNSYGKSRYICTTGYSFLAFLQLTDNNDKILGTIMLIDTTEEYSIDRFFLSSSKADQVSVSNYIPMKDLTKLNTSPLQADQLASIYSYEFSRQSQEEPEDYVKQHSQQMLPTEKELYGLIWEKIIAGVSNMTNSYFH